jgi:4-amino-4-deoxy-L-arabinose transferase-like glycosyltransferase
MRPDWRPDRAFFFISSYSGFVSSTIIVYVGVPGFSTGKFSWRSVTGMIRFVKIAKTDLKAGALVFGLSLFMFSLGIGRSSIYILDESKNAQCAWEMMHSADHIVPTFNGSLRTDKPPLHYYAMMFGFVLFGKSAFAARLVSSLTGAVFMSLLFLFVSRHINRSVAIWTILTLLGSILWVVEFHLAVPDPYLIALVGIGLMAFFHFSETGKRWAILTMYAILSLAFLAKGPVGIGLPAIIILLHLLLTRRLNGATLWCMLPFHGLAIFLVVVIPWYWSVYDMSDGEWFRGFFLDHNFHRFSRVMEGHGGIFLVTVGYFLVGLLPFVLFFWGTAKKAWRERENRLVLFSLEVVAVFLLFFSISRTRLPNYTMPCYPFAAILIGRRLHELAEGKGNGARELRIGTWILLGISMAIPVGAWYAVRFEPLLANLPGPGLEFAFLPVGILVATWFVYRKKEKRALFIIAATFMLASAILVTVTMPRLDSRNPVRQSIHLLDQAGTVGYFGKINPSYIFNHGQVERLDDTIQVKRHLREPGNILVTSLQVVQGDQKFFGQYEVLYSGKDLFDLNHTVILGPVTRR